MPLDLTNPDQLVPLLQKYGLYTQKHLGQHFLIDSSVLEQAINDAHLQSTETVVEVGAGTGVLTQQLAARAATVLAFEIDPHLNHLLAQTLADFNNVKLSFADFLKVDFNAAIGQTPYKFVANLPYNVGSHIIDILIKSPNPPQSITVLLQKEVAQKMVAQPPQATYLSNFVSTYGAARITKIVKPTSFFPAPAVDSAILHIEKYSDSAAPIISSDISLANIDAIKFSKFLHRGFANPRKMLNKAFNPEELKAATIDPQRRPENLSLNDWLRLYRSFEAESAAFSS